MVEQVARRPVALSPCMSLNTPSTDYPEEGAIDMEASAFFQAATKFSNAELVQSYKVVSDTPEQSFEGLNAKVIQDLMQPHTSKARDYLASLTSLADKLPVVVPKLTMVDTLYIERDVIADPRAQAVASRYPKASQLEIEHYGEVFNSAKQNFRLQKSNPSLILAAKKGKRVMPTPAQYETGGGAHYYFSHMLNCVYDCRYCFLQGMLRSANYLLFVNYDEFLADIRDLANKHSADSKPAWFFSGYDCDSLAYEPVTRFAEYFVPAFKEFDNAVLELRTKSTQIRSLLNIEPQENVVVAYSLSPERIATEVEQGAPPLKKRIEALKRLQEHGWRILADYRTAIPQVFEALQAEQIDSVTLGGFRLPKGFYKTMHKLHPEHWLFNAGLNEEEGMMVYRKEIEDQALKQVSHLC